MHRLGRPERIIAVVVAVLVMADVVAVANLLAQDSGAPSAAGPFPTLAVPSTTQAPATTTTGPPPTTTTVPQASRTAVPLPAPAGAPGRDVTAYAGLGTWVDVYDYAAEFQANGAAPPIAPGAIDAMADQGVRTLFLQASKDDPRSPPGDLVHPELLAEFLTRAHARGMRVVAWFLPKLADVDSDLRHMLAMRDYQTDGQRFDGIAVDIEWRAGVADHAERSARLVDLSRRLRAATNGEALGAIVMPPVVTDVINPAFWPGFPWSDLGPLYDVWLPMGYWTSRTQESGWRDTFRYTDQNIALLRKDLGNPNAVVHPIGGIGDRSTDEDYRGFLRAATSRGSVGFSIYDYRTTAPSAWGVLRGGS